MVSNRTMFIPNVMKVCPVVQELQEDTRSHVYTNSVVMSSALFFLQKGKRAKNSSNTINHITLGKLSDDYEAVC